MVLFSNLYLFLLSQALMLELYYLVFTVLPAEGKGKEDYSLGFSPFCSDDKSPKWPSTFSLRCFPNIDRRKSKWERLVNESIIFLAGRRTKLAE
jgi:hypothetical protein